MPVRYDELPVFTRTDANAVAKVKRRIILPTHRAFSGPIMAAQTGGEISLKADGLAAVPAPYWSEGQSRPDARWVTGTGTNPPPDEAQYGGEDYPYLTARIPPFGKIWTAYFSVDLPDNSLVLDLVTIAAMVEPSKKAQYSVASSLFRCDPFQPLLSVRECIHNTVSSDNVFPLPDGATSIDAVWDRAATTRGPDESLLVNYDAFGYWLKVTVRSNVANDEFRDAAVFLAAVIEYASPGQVYSHAVG